MKKRKAASRCWENISNDLKQNTRFEKTIKGKWLALFGYSQILHMFAQLNLQLLQNATMYSKN